MNMNNPKHTSDTNRSGKVYSKLEYTIFQNLSSRLYTPQWERCTLITDQNLVSGHYNLFFVTSLIKVNVKLSLCF